MHGSKTLGKGCQAIADVICGSPNRNPHVVEDLSLSVESWQHVSGSRGCRTDLSGFRWGNRLSWKKKEVWVGKHEDGVLVDAFSSHFGG